MTAIGLGTTLLVLLKLVVFEGIVLGIAWIVGQVFGISVAYILIASITAGFWLLVIGSQLLFLKGFKQTADKMEKDFWNN